jgi:dTDP-4-amino-4,6-dideoxygalactose transaminase
VDVPFLDLARHWESRRAELMPVVERTLANGRWVLGPSVEAFEEAWARRCGVAHAVGVGNGFDALALVLRAWGIGPGDEVIVPALTATPTWMAVASLGATPVAVDVDVDTSQLDPELLEAAVSSRTRAVVAVHLYGVPAPVDTIAAVASEHGLPVLEDAAQAHGAELGGRSAGALASAAAFSFYPTKNLGGVGDGGAVVTDDPALAAAVRELRMYGWGERDDPARIGVNSRLDELQAAVLLHKLDRLDADTERRRALAARYTDALADVPGLFLPVATSGSRPCWHLYAVRHDRRDELRARLAERGVGTGVHYPRAMADTVAFRGAGGPAPVASRIAATTLSLPLNTMLSDAEQDHVIDAVRRELAG